MLFRSARGQVVHFDFSANIWNQIKDPMYKFRRLLPIDIQVRKVSIVPEDFDARYSALTRRYSYTVCDSKDGLDPLNSRFVLDYRKKLDDHSMNKASQMLIGLNDFSWKENFNWIWILRINQKIIMNYKYFMVIWRN